VFSGLLAIVRDPSALLSTRMVGVEIAVPPQSSSERSGDEFCAFVVPLRSVLQPSLIVRVGLIEFYEQISWRVDGIQAD
jgi:hypothetical protein